MQVLVIPVCDLCFVVCIYATQSFLIFYRKVTAADQGAYSCEALSPEGPVLATPDAILIVDNNPVEPTEGS